MKNIIKKKLIPSLLCGLIVLSSFRLVFANGELPIYSSAPSYSTLIDSPVYTSNSSEYHYGSNNSSVDYFYYHNTSQNNYPIIFVFSSNLSDVKIYRTRSGNSDVQTIASFTSFSSLKYSSPNYFTSSDDIYGFPFLGEFAYLDNALSYYITNGVSYPEPEPTTQGYTTLENGNIVYFDLGLNVSYDIDIESYFYSKSGVVSGIWADDNRRYGFSDSLPSVNTSIGESSGNALSFTKSTKGQNLLGQTNYGDVNISGTSSGRYLWIINPMYNNKYFEDSLSAEAINGLMTISGVSAGTTVYTYKLKQNASSIGLDSDIPSISGGIGSVATESGIQTQFVSTEDNTQSYTQTVGGDNSAPEEVSAVEGIRQTLDQFVNGFMNLFSAPISHIQQLISSGSSFIQYLGGLYSWLPIPVTNVLTSALVLFIVIGVLKMLL